MATQKNYKQLLAVYVSLLEVTQQMVQETKMIGSLDQITSVAGFARDILKTATTLHTKLLQWQEWDEAERIGEAIANVRAEI